MQRPIKGRIGELREEIALRETNRLYLARWQKDSRRSRSRTSASKIAGNPRRINVADWLEKAMNNVDVHQAFALTAARPWFWASFEYL
jgi:hypothetical protein